ncbi:MAG: response regulator [Gammaproteobacteria bacterium]|nr:response regulator [Gammaproteobacteria bacterium]
MISTARILLVDDEPMVLQALTRQLRKHFTVFSAVSGAEGLALLAREGEMDVIVSDMRMPQMSGAEFLTACRVLYPETPRVLLTGHAEIEAAIAVVNEGQIFRYLMKPCEENELINALEAAVTKRQQRLQDIAQIRNARTQVDAAQHATAAHYQDSNLGVTNYEGFAIAVKDLLQKTHEHGEQASFILFTPSNFKKLKNSAAESLVNRAVKLMVELIRHLSPRSARLYSVAEAEIVIVLPNTEVQQAVDFARRVSEQFNGLAITTNNGAQLVGLGFGVVDIHSIEVVATAADILESLHQDEQTREMLRANQLD